MKIHSSDIAGFNEKHLIEHQNSFDIIASQLEKKDINVQKIIKTLADFQVAIPTWALGAGGTRFGRFSIGGEPRNLEEKIEDVGLLHALTQTAGAISLHIPWDIPTDALATKQQAVALGLVFDAVNSNTFQDQENQKRTYKFGSLCSVDELTRAQAIEHNVEVITYGKSLGSKSITVWLADGAVFPGQQNFRRALENTQDSLNAIYRHLPDDWRMFIEYKPYEPNFYSMVIPDWGTSLLLAEACGEKAFTLVDLGHHLPNTNIEQIVSTLMMKGRLGGFHFNDSKYGDDDLTCGSIKPFQLFLIFNELVYGLANNNSNNPPLAWMIDASHNIKDPLEDLMQSLEAIQLAFAQALCVDSKRLDTARSANDVVRCQEILQDAYRMDLRPLIREAALKRGGALYPVEVFRSLDIRKKLIAKRGSKTIATGL